MESNEPLQTITKSAAPEILSETLAPLIEKAKTERLSPAEEEQAVQILKAQILAGKTALTSAVRDAAKLSWIVGVGALAGVWAELKPTAQKTLLTALRKETSDSALRLRLSFARALFKIDPALAAKQTAAFCAELLASDESNAPKNAPLAPKYRQLIFNVLISKGRPWLLHLPVDALKKNELAALSRCAVHAGFEPKGAPFTQLSLLGWLANHQLIDQLDADTLAHIAKCVEKWNTRWKKDLVKIANLPESIQAAAIIPANRESAENQTSAPETQSAQTEKKLPKNRESRHDEKSRKIVDEKPESAPTKTPLIAHSPDLPAAREARDTKPSAPRAQRESHYPSPAKDESRGPREQAHSRKETFHLPNALRQIDAYVASLQNELAKARAEIKRLDSSSGRRSRRMETTAAAIGDDFNADELRRHNAQLEETITELRQHLEELTTNSEDVAVSRQADSEAEQLRTLLGLRLNEKFAEFQAMKNEAADEVFREHYRDLLDFIFDLLQQQGIQFR